MNAYDTTTTSTQYEMSHRMNEKYKKQENTEKEMLI